jgi:hypothetical protein
MDAAFQFHDQFGRVAEEIHDPVANLVLAAEFVP